MNDLSHAGWRRIKFMGVARLVDAGQVLAPHLRWHWRYRVDVQKKRRRARPQLRLVSPRAVVWDFRLHGAAWIRRPQADQPNNEGDKHDGLA